MLAQKKITQKIVSALGSNVFFWVVVALLIVQAAWFALTANYPQAFDEQWHFQFIQIYSHQWSPFFAHQPAGAHMMGELARSPAYLYHYLLSFIYRLIELFTSSQTAQVIILRLLNVGFFAAGLWVYRKVLGLLPLSRAAINVVLLFVVLVPVTPLLAGQISYDNLLFLLTGISLLWFVKLYRRLTETGTFSLQLAIGLLALNTLASIEKYVFLPIFAAEVILLAWTAIKLARRKKLLLRDSILNSWRAGSKLVLTISIVLAVIGCGLFAERFGINLVKYHNISPACTEVISEQKCKELGPWLRDYYIKQHHYTTTTVQKVEFVGVWTKGMIREFVFTISSGFAADGSVNYWAAKSLPITNGLAWAALFIGLIVLVRYCLRLWRLLPARVFLLATLFYTAALFVTNLSSYLSLGRPVAIHGRYLMPLLPVIFGLIMLGVLWAIRQYRWLSWLNRYKAWIFIVVLLLYLQGGGLTTFIIRSQDRWLWNSPLARTATHVAKDIISPVIVSK